MMRVELAAVALGGILVALLLATIVGVVVYVVGAYLLHAPAVGLIAFLILLVVLVLMLPGRL